MTRQALTVCAAGLVLMLAACSEKPQTAGTPKQDQQAYAGTGVAAFTAPMAHCQKLHAHAGNFTELHRCGAIAKQRLIDREHGVKGVAGFVRHGFNIAGPARGIHEYEWAARVLEHVLIAAGSLAFAAIKIEVGVVLCAATFASGAEFCEHGGEAGIEFIE